LNHATIGLYFIVGISSLLSLNWKDSKSFSKRRNRYKKLEKEITNLEQEAKAAKEEVKAEKPDVKPVQELEAPGKEKVGEKVEPAEESKKQEVPAEPAVEERMPIEDVLDKLVEDDGAVEPLDKLSQKITKDEAEAEAKEKTPRVNVAEARA